MNSLITVPEKQLGNFNAYAPAYVANWNKLAVRSDRLAEVHAAARALVAGKAEYQTCSAACGGIPWWFFGLCLYRENEDDFLHQRFQSYLGNGQPLDQRTTKVPIGHGPFKDFAAGAVDTMRLQGLIGTTDWGVARTCYRIEAENGFGYHMYGVNSPYLYGATTLYGPPQAKGGKYVGDHDFNPRTVDTQLGTLAILKCAMEIDSSIAFTAPPAPGPQPDDNLGEGVAWVQRALNTLDRAGLTVDGILGRNTMAAILAYQRAQRLKATGLPDAETISSLQAIMSPAKPIAAHAAQLMGSLFGDDGVVIGVSQDKALDALEAAVYAEVARRFAGSIANEYTPSGFFARLKRSVAPPDLDRAVTSFDRDVENVLQAHARCRDVILRRFPS